MAALTTLAVLIAVFLVLLPQLSRPPSTGDASARLETARRLLEEGSFHRALEELDAAERERQSRPASLGREETRRLERLRRQGRLLDALLNEPLEDLLRQASSVRRDAEWQQHFARDYKGRTVLFDDEVGLDAAGRPELRSYAVEVGGERARAALEDLTLLRQLPLVPPQRLVFGARLARFERDGDGWVIGFEPDSGVLLTDPEALASWRPSLLDDDLRAVLRRQEGWLGAP
jgi:hypothetical protein